MVKNYLSSAQYPKKDHYKIGNAEIGISAIFHFNKKLRSVLKKTNSDPI